MEPPTLAQLREIAERAEFDVGLYTAVFTPALALQLLDLIEHGGTP